MSGKLITLVLLVLALVFPTSISHAAASPAGSAITNRATLSYTDPETGETISLESNTVTTTVQRVQSLLLESDNRVQAPSGATVSLPHRLTNTGNAPSTIFITAQNESGDGFDLAEVTVYRDLNGNGRFDTGEPIVQRGVPVTLEPSETLDLVVVGTVQLSTTEGQSAQVLLVARTEDNAVAVTNTDIVTVGQALALQLRKSASASTVAPGADVTFTLVASNNESALPAGIPITIDGAPQTRLIIRDQIPAGTTFVSATSASPDARVLYHRAGDPLHTYVSTPPTDRSQIDAVAYSSENLAQGEFRVTLTVRAGAGARGIENIAQLHYSNPSTPEPNDTITSNGVIVAVSASGANINFYSDNGYSTPVRSSLVGRPLFLQGTSASCNVDPAAVDQAIITITSQLTGDVEMFQAQETGPNTGVFRITTTVATRSGEANPTVSGNGIIETNTRDTLTARLGCGSGQETLATTTLVLIDPYGVVFDSRTNQPIAGATVVLFDVKKGAPAQVFDVDGVTPAPSTVVTGPDGSFSFPLVPPGEYRLLVTPPGTYSVPLSPIPAGQLPSGRAIVPGSFGEPFEVSEATGAVRVDIPLIAPLAETPILIQKTASKFVAEIGDVIDYQIIIKNFTGGPLTGLTVTDSLPVGFVYQPGTARLQGASISDPAISDRTLSFALGDLAVTPDGDPGISLLYRVRIGPGTRIGDNHNRAQAAGSLLGAPRLSNQTSARVRVQGGVFNERGIIFGKVFVDADRSGEQEAGELGIPGVRVFLEDGTFSVTDSEGKYTIYGISARTHVVKVDMTSMPAGSVMVALTNRHGRDAASSFVDLKKGELHKVNFAEGTATEEILANVKARRAKGEVFVAETERRLKTDLTSEDVPLENGDVRSRPATGVVGGNTTIPSFRPVLPDPELSAPARDFTNDSIRTAPTVKLDELLPSLTSEIGFVDLKDKDTLPADQINVRVKGAIGSEFKLFVNDREISESRVGTKSSLQEKKIEAWEYIGLSLRAGESTLEVRQIDAFGNQRGSQKITVIAPGKLGKLRLIVPQKGHPADGHTPVRVRVELTDDNGAPVTARTPITLEASYGRWQTEDLNKAEPGQQVFIEGGSAEFILLPPQEPGDSLVRVTSGVLQNRVNITFVPELRPLIAVGVIEGKVNFLGFEPRGTRDVFEEESGSLLQAKSGNAQLESRAAMYLKGRVKGSYLLTLRYDSEEVRERLFRDIQPDEFYPVYGDASIKGFDAQSTGRLYVRVDKEKSYFLYGDYTTESFSESRSLGSYSRSFTGVKQHIETNKIIANFFASRDNTRQEVEEIRAVGTSGPYLLRNNDIVLNSEIVEIIIRDREQPGVVLKRTPQTRFLDYEIDELTGRILFRRPIPSLDEDLNPIFIRVIYEAEQGGQKFWVTGIDGQVRLSDRLEVGGSWIRDENPQDSNSLRSINATLRFGNSTFLVGELAQSNRLSLGKGTGHRVELRHESDRLQARLFHGKTDRLFDNPTSVLSRGRSESSLKMAYRIDGRTRLLGEAIRTQDEFFGGTRQGVLASVERSFDNNVRLELGVRHGKETAAPAQPGSTGATPNNFTSLRAKVSAQVPRLPAASVYGEYERDIRDSSKQLLALGGDYQFANRSRLYLRHELLSSLSGRYALNDTQERHTTLMGVDTDYMRDGRLFSEYRIRDAISGREAEAAIGLRNQWTLGEGLRAHTSFERVHGLGGLTANEAMALTGALEYTRNPLWKATGRLELRRATEADNILGTFGVAYKLGQDWTLLGRGIMDLRSGRGSDISSVLGHRVQMGLAYRQTERDRLNALLKYEFRNERDDASAFATGLRRKVHILSADVNYQPSRPVLLSLHYAGKLATDGSNDLTTSTSAHLLSGRVTYDLTPRFDVGLIGSTLFGNTGGRQYGLGAEVGYMVQENMWFSAGYNLSGYRENDLVENNLFNRGPYLRLRMKFDESLFGVRSGSSVALATTKKPANTSTTEKINVAKSIADKAAQANKQAMAPARPSVAKPALAMKPVEDVKSPLVATLGQTTPPRTISATTATPTAPVAPATQSQPVEKPVVEKPVLQQALKPEDRKPKATLARKKAAPLLFNQSKGELRADGEVIKISFSGPSGALNHAGNATSPLAAMLRAHPQLRAEIIEFGTRLSASPARAAALKQRIVSAGVGFNRIATRTARADEAASGGRIDQMDLQNVGRNFEKTVLISTRLCVRLSTEQFAPDVRAQLAKEHAASAIQPKGGVTLILPKNHVSKKPQPARADDIRARKARAASAAQKKVPREYIVDK